MKVSELIPQIEMIVHFAGHGWFVKFFSNQTVIEQKILKIALSTLSFPLSRNICRLDMLFV